MNSDDDSDLDFGEIENLSSLQPAGGIVLPKHIAPPPPSACFVNIKAAKKRLNTYKSPELNEAANLLLQPEVDEYIYNLYVLVKKVVLMILRIR